MQTPTPHISNAEFRRRRELQRQFAAKMSRRGVNFRQVASLAAQGQRRFDRIFGGHVAVAEAPAPAAAEPAPNPLATLRWIVGVADQTADQDAAQALCLCADVALATLAEAEAVQA